MERELFKEKDVVILDTILELVLSGKEIIGDAFGALDNIILKNIPIETRVDTFISYYCEILKTYNILDFKDFEKLNKIYQIPKRTEKFYNEGGFKTIYDKQQKEIERNKKSEKLSLEKLEWDTQLSKFQVQTKWWPLGISILSLVISVIALLT